MRILLVNDDGFQSEGLNALTEALSVKHDVFVMAPSVEQSGMSHAATFYKPLRVERIENKNCECRSVSGTPVDCVMLGVLEFGKLQPFDLIVCGINDVPNLGTDIMFSGTVQQAIEGIYLGVPAIAISGDLKDKARIDRTAEWFAENLGLFYELAKITAVNINVPKFYTDAYQFPIKLTNIGYLEYSDRYLKSVRENGVAFYTLVGEIVSRDKSDKNSDTVWFQKGFVTVSPLTIGLNDENLLARFSEVLK